MIASMAFSFGPETHLKCGFPEPGLALAEFQRREDVVLLEGRPAARSAGGRGEGQKAMASLLTEFIGGSSVFRLIHTPIL